MTPESDLYKRIFGEQTKDAILNMNKFIVAGHSFGGVCAVDVAK